MRMGMWITDFIKNVYPQYKNYPHTIHRVSTGFSHQMWINRYGAENGGYPHDGEIIPQGSQVGGFSFFMRMSMLDFN